MTSAGDFIKILSVCLHETTVRYVLWHAENTLVSVRIQTGKAAPNRRFSRFLLLHPQLLTLSSTSTLQAGHKVAAYSKIVGANLAKTGLRASPMAFRRLVARIRICRPRS